MYSRPTNDENVKTEVDLWAVDKLGNGWGIPRNLGDVVNTLGIRDGSPGAAANGNLYFFSERQGGKRASDIYRSRYVDGNYTIPENLGPVINGKYWDGHPYNSPDETFLIFYSNRPGGYGRGDLYFSYNRNGIWTTPENLGASVNSEAQEITPHLSPDRKFLYFGRIYKDGKRDIYYVNAASTSLDLN